MVGFMDNGDLPKIKVLMFPWLAHGHISPYLELARKLIKRNFFVYLCSTPANLSSTKQRFRENVEEFSPQSIQLVELHLPHNLPDLPPHYHTTNGLPPHLMAHLKFALDMSYDNFKNILGTLKPNLLIYDLLQPWAPQAASTYNVPSVAFATCSATMSAFMIHDYLFPYIKFPFPSIYYRDYEAAGFNKLQRARENFRNGKPKVLECFKSSCDMVLVKSCRDIEGKYSDYLSKILGKEIIPVGLLAQENGNDDDHSCNILEWLSRMGNKSTVFVSFGSEYFLSKDDLEEIAYGLELSLVNFIWVVRFPKDSNLKLEDELPKGFLKRIEGRGLVVGGWAPQAKILKHQNIGGFVSHCGWSSIVESMKFGVPVIAIPMHLDQPANARLAQEIGIAVEIFRDDSGKLHRDEIAKVVKKVILEKTGQVLRESAANLSEKIGEGGDKEMDEVAHKLEQLCVKWSSNGRFSSQAFKISLEN